MAPTVPLPLLGPLAAGAMSVAFLRSLWPHRDRPGGWLFLATIAGVTFLCAVEAASLLVFDPALRELFETPRWLGLHLVPAAFLGFALQYTGRSHLLRSPWAGVLAVWPPVAALTVATNPVHGLAYADYRVDPVLGAATVVYEPKPLLVADVATIVAVAGVAVLLLLDVFASYRIARRMPTASAVG